MSKTTVKKSLQGFDAEELRQLILDLYAKSKEAKEILDFYSVPNLSAKIEEYKKPIYKEVYRRSRGVPKPRFSKIKPLLKRMKMLDVGDEAMGELMAYVVIEVCRAVADGTTTSMTTNASIIRFATETLEFMKPRLLLPEYGPQIAKAVNGIKDHRYYVNPLKQQLLGLLRGYEKEF